MTISSSIRVKPDSRFFIDSLPFKGLCFGNVAARAAPARFSDLSVSLSEV
jgi:hypothetical protein